MITKVDPVSTRFQYFGDIFYVGDNIVSCVNKITRHYTVPAIYGERKEKMNALTYVTLGR